MILLIQLHAATRHITAEILGKAGYPVEEAGDGAEALRLLHIQQLQLIIVDVLMPMFAGVDVAASIRRTRPQIPLLLTRYMPPDGADAFWSNRWASSFNQWILRTAVERSPATPAK